LRDKRSKDRRFFEIMLIVIALGMTLMLSRLGGHRMVALNLFFLPVVLSGYYLGRNSAGVLALFSALAVTVAVTTNSSGLGTYDSPVVMSLALTIWAGSLGLTALLVGTLCDERATGMEELEVAYVGVVEVLTRYLRSGDPSVKTRSARVAELSQGVAEEMRLTRKQVDDVRVGALLCDLGDVEITTTLINKAVHTVGNVKSKSQHTFLGTDLVQSLGSVLHGALPLLVTQDESVRELISLEAEDTDFQTPVGARIIRTVREFDRLIHEGNNGTTLDLVAALKELRDDTQAAHDPEVLAALERAVAQPQRQASTARQTVTV